MTAVPNPRRSVFSENTKNGWPTVRPGFFRVLTLAANSGGAALPRNEILAAATGEYVFFVDADDTIGTLALERIAEVVGEAPADWIALNQVAMNGRAAVCEVHRPQEEVPMVQALSTLTVHKVFRRAEIERQQLQFDEGLPSGQDLSFAFSYIINAKRFVMLGGYDYYYLTQHLRNPSEPAHLSKRNRTPQGLIDKGERILRSMLESMTTSELPESELRAILIRAVLPRMLLREQLLSRIVELGPEAGPPALQRLSAMLDLPLLTGLDPAGVKGLTKEHLSLVADRDWAGLARLVGPPAPIKVVGPSRLVRVQRFFDSASGRARHRRVLTELRMLRRSVDELRSEQSELKKDLDRQTPH